MKQEMRPSLRLQQIPEEACDFGIEPRANTTMGLDLELRDDSRLYPVVVLNHGGKEARLVFQGGYDLASFYSPNQEGIRREWLRTAEVWFMLDEDPSTEIVTVSILYQGSFLDYVTSMDALRQWFAFPYPVVANLDFDETDADADILGLLDMVA